MSDVLIGLVQDFFGVASGSHDHEDSGFGGATPKGVMHLMGYGTALNSRRNDAQLAIGSGQGNTQGNLWTFGNSSAHNQGSAACYKKAMDTKVGWIHGPTDTFRDGWHHFAATPFATNKTTYDVDNTYNSNYAAISLLLGGADLEFATGTIDHSNDAQDSSIWTTTGFDMSNAALLICGVNSGFDAGTGTAEDSRWGYGVGSTSDGITFSQACTMVGESHGSSAGNPVAYINSQRIAQRISLTDGSPLHSLEWTDVDATAGGRFQTTCREASTGTGTVFGYLAIGLPSDWNANVSIEALPGSVSNPTEFRPTGISGWTPSLLIQIMTLMGAVNAARTNNEAGGIGVRVVKGTTAGDEYSMSANMEDAADPTDTQSLVADAGVMDEDDGGTLISVALDSFQSGGWDDNFTATAAKQWISLAIGPDDVGGADYTGTSAATTGSVAASGSGTFTAPIYSGDSVATTGAATAAASGTFTAPEYSATSVAVTGSATAAGVGTFEVPVYSGDSTAIVGATVAAAVGTFAAPIYSGDSVAATGSVVASASGTFTELQVFTGTSIAVAGATTAVAAGTFAAPIYSGDSVATTGSVEAAASGMFAAAIYSGTSVAVTGSVTASASGTFEVPVYSATSVATTGAAAASASGIFAAALFEATSDAVTGAVTAIAVGTFTDPIQHPCTSGRVTLIPVEPRATLVSMAPRATLVPLDARTTLVPC